MSKQEIDTHVPLYADLMDGLPTSIDTGRPLYKCGCCSITREPFFKETGDFCDPCESMPKRVYMNLVTGQLALVEHINS